MENEVQIGNVSDTSIWVAYYRARETERPDALFKDPLAKILIGEQGKQFADHMAAVGEYVELSVITRTLIIDEFIQQMIREGIDTVINLGAGLDTRPYRMNLPANLNWIEVDFPRIISLKNSRLKDQTPTCQLSRVELDLSDDGKRKQFFKEAAANTKKALIITEGVIPYLASEKVSNLAEELQAHPQFSGWITEYFDAKVYPYLQRAIRTEKMKSAPFVFYPPDWNGFFKEHGWVQKDIRYTGEVARQNGRPMPMPWWASMLTKIFGEKIADRSRRMTGYILFQRS